ncbi:MAG: hypothetical protein OEV01_08900 [Nitrospira sp.]|nr:hypothetical protein [Nitrospira sp.]
MPLSLGRIEPVQLRGSTWCDRIAYLGTLLVRMPGGFCTSFVLRHERRSVALI